MAITEVRSNYAGTEKLVDTTHKKQETEETAYKNTKEYSDYLSSKYSCLQEVKDSLVTIAPDLLSKAATDNKTGQWLEENLKLIPNVVNKIRQNAAQNGSQIVSCNISFDGYDNMTTQVHTVSEVETGTEDMKKALEEIWVKNKERKKEQEELLEKRENLQNQKFLTTDVENLFQKVTHFDFAHKNSSNRVSIDFKI